VIARELLPRRWVHSHEEDTDDEMVFRDASSGYTFPPARGRTAFELRPDGSYVETAPGPDDRPAEGPGGSWTLEEGDNLRLEDRVLQIKAVEDDVLRVRR
jgi:hypothetical protein